VIDETRIKRALRQGPPFRTAYVQQPVPLGSKADPHPSRLLAYISVTVLLVAAVGGAALVGSGAVKLPSLIVNPTRPSPTPTGWVATGRIVSPRIGGHTVTLLDDGTVLVTGGAADDPNHIPASSFPPALTVERLASAELLDPATLTWTATGSLTQPRSNHTATLLPDGRVLVAGGLQDRAGTRAVRGAELYDPATRTWTPTGEMTQPRSQHSATVLLDGRVLVAGGFSEDAYVNSAELYDPATGTWTRTGDMTAARGRHTATVLPDGRVLVVGGVSGNVWSGPCCGPLSSAELFDPSTGIWTATGSTTDPSGELAATQLLDGRVLIVAGPYGPSPSGDLYDPATGTWSPTSPLIEPLAGLTAVLLLDGRVLVAGGWVQGPPDTFTGLATAQIYDPETNLWSVAPDMLASRGEGQVAIRLADGRVLLVGGTASMYGRNQPGVLSDPAAEIYDPAGGN
jgi:N-acetylneuraminic acid mutarotase